jgi:hypothetical protein
VEVSAVTLKDELLARRSYRADPSMPVPDAVLRRRQLLHEHHEPVRMTTRMRPVVPGDVFGEDFSGEEPRHRIVHWTPMRSVQSQAARPMPLLRQSMAAIDAMMPPPGWKW